MSTASTPGHGWSTNMKARKKTAHQQGGWICLCSDEELPTWHFKVSFVAIIVRRLLNNIIVFPYLCVIIIASGTAKRLSLLPNIQISIAVFV